MIFNITNEEDSLKQEAVNKQVAKQNIEESKQRLKEMGQLLKKHKEEGNMLTYYQLLRWCMC